MIGRLGRAERLFSRGQRLAGQGCTEEALQVFDQAVAMRPRAAGFQLHKAFILSETGRLPEAEETMQHAMALQPRNPVLPMFLGQMCFDHAEYHMARTWCQRALTLNPRNSHAIALHALIDMALGEVPDACQRLRQPLWLAMESTKRGPFSGGKHHRPSVLQLSNPAFQSRLLLFIETYLLQHTERAHTLFQQQTAAYREQEACDRAGILGTLDRLCTRGVMSTKRLWIHASTIPYPSKRAYRLLCVDAEEAYYLGNSTAALARYTELLKQRPEDVELRRRLFEISYEQGDSHQALEHLRALLGAETAVKDLHPWHALCLGELLYQNGHFAEASRYLNQAATQPQDYKLFYYQGLCCLHAGQSHDARRLFARATQMLNPDISDMRLNEMLRVHRELVG